MAQPAPHLSEGSSGARDNAQEGAGRCRPGLRVPNVDDGYRRMVERNMPCLQEPKDVCGARVTQHVDPDGRPISVGEDRQGS